MLALPRMDASFSIEENRVCGLTGSHRILLYFSIDFGIGGLLFDKIISPNFSQNAVTRPRRCMQINVARTVGRLDESIKQCSDLGTTQRFGAVMIPSSDGQPSHPTVNSAVIQRDSPYPSAITTRPKFPRIAAADKRSRFSKMS